MNLALLDPFELGGTSIPSELTHSLVNPPLVHFPSHPHSTDQPNGEKQPIIDALALAMEAERGTHQNENFTTVCKFHPVHGRQLASGTTAGLIIIWDLDTYRVKRTLRGHAAQVTCMDWHSMPSYFHLPSTNNSPTSNTTTNTLMITGSLDFSLLFHNPETGERLWKLGMGSGILGCCLQPLVGVETVPLPGGVAHKNSEEEDDSDDEEQGESEEDSEDMEGDVKEGEVDGPRTSLKRRNSSTSSISGVLATKNLIASSLKKKQVVAPQPPPKKQKQSAATIKKQEQEKQHLKDLQNKKLKAEKLRKVKEAEAAAAIEKIKSEPLRVAVIAQGQKPWILSLEVDKADLQGKRKKWVRTALELDLPQAGGLMDLDGEDSSSREIFYTAPASKTIACCLSFSPNAKILVVGTNKGTFAVFSTDTSKLVYTHVVAASSVVIHQLVFSNCSPLTAGKTTCDLIVNGSDKTIRRFILDWPAFPSVSLPSFLAGKKYADTVSRNPFHFITLSAPSTGSEHVVGITGDNVKHIIYVWERISGELVRQLHGPWEGVGGLEWHPNLPICASISESGGHVFLWRHTPQQKFAAYDPTFTEFEDNKEYIEREDEFDIVLVPAGKEKRDQEMEEIQDVDIEG